MLASLLNVPRTPQEWSLWSFANKDAINTIQAAILDQKGITLTAYPLDPIDNIEEFLERNQQSHADIMSVLGIQSSDLESVNLKEPRELQAWVYLCHRELYDAAAQLGVDV